MFFKMLKFLIHFISIVILIAFVAAEKSCPQFFSSGCSGDKGIAWIIPFFISLFGGLAFPVLSLMFVLQRFFPHKRFIPVVMIHLAAIMAILPFMYVDYRNDAANRRLMENLKSN